MNSHCNFRWCRIGILLSALTSAGCVSVRYPQNYVLEVQPTTRPAASSQNAFGPLAVREFQCADYVCDGRIVYRPTPHEVAYYEYHRWAVSPRQMITQSVARGVRATGQFTSVALRGGNAEAGYLLTGELERLEEVDNGNDVHAVCVLSAQLTDGRTKQVIWSHSETARVPVVARNMAGVVHGLSAATRAAVDALVASLQQRLESVRSGQ
jgi:ABC-type uncharacterized transport system auxiliary subunit